MKEKATFGMGCFWGSEDVFAQVLGVIETAVGYMGGNFDNPTYEDVCSDKTGHAEVVEVTYNPNEVSYEKLLDIFWKNHNPTTPNRQGPDHGSQYRSVIFTHTPEQEKIAHQSLKDHEAWAVDKFGDPIATIIEPAKTFWRAEEYHQKYFSKKGIKGTCHF